MDENKILEAINDLRKDMQAMEKNIRSDMQAMEQGIRSDMQAMEQGIRSDMQAMEKGIRSDMQAMEQGIRSDMQAIEQGIRSDMQAMEQGIRSDMQAMEKGIRKDMVDKHTYTMREFMQIEKKIDRNKRINSREHGEMISTIDDRYEDLKEQIELVNDAIRTLGVLSKENQKEHTLYNQLLNLKSI